MISKLESQLVNIYLTQNLESYKVFMGIEKMPSFNVIVNEIELEEAIQSGYGVIASHTYNVQTDEHILKVSKDIYNNNRQSQYILFHEFTHMYDVLTYSAKDKMLYAANRGFTEYHASQIELLKLVGAKSIEQKISFSLKQQIETITGNTTVLKYIMDTREGTRNLISKANFPDNLESLSAGLGMIFNLLGRISICRMYANDYEIYKDELENMEFEESYFGENFSKILSIMKGFLDKTAITQIGNLYFPIILEQVNKMQKNC